MIHACTQKPRCRFQQRGHVRSIYKNLSAGREEFADPLGGLAGHRPEPDVGLGFPGVSVGQVSGDPDQGGSILADDFPAGGDHPGEPLDLRAGGT